MLNELKAGYPAFDSDMAQLMRYFLYTNVLGAVYDGRLLAAVKMAVFNCLIIRRLTWESLRRQAALHEKNRY